MGDKIVSVFMTNVEENMHQNINIDGLLNKINLSHEYKRAFIKIETFNAIRPVIEKFSDLVDTVINISCEGLIDSYNFGPDADDVMTLTNANTGIILSTTGGFDLKAIPMDAEDPDAIIPIDLNAQATYECRGEHFFEMNFQQANNIRLHINLSEEDTHLAFNLLILLKFTK